MVKLIDFIVFIWRHPPRFWLTLLCAPLKELCKVCEWRSNYKQTANMQLDYISMSYRQSGHSHLNGLSNPNWRDQPKICPIGTEPK
ncbi:hypothetical protein A9255_20080 [Xenorhabdus hominickii]|uniref:Secreted protein n=1 Tax=Xenorhabdus hominickii TaxID=351679 RepID=A0ABN4S8H5_XENHO|nr:hypothetical protein A9255_20080 [Xenorhabdus hominickii]